MRTKRLHEDYELVAGVVDASLAPGVPGVAPHVTGVALTLVARC